MVHISQQSSLEPFSCALAPRSCLVLAPDNSNIGTFYYGNLPGLLGHVPSLPLFQQESWRIWARDFTPQILSDPTNGKNVLLGSGHRKSPQETPEDRNRQKRADSYYQAQKEIASHLGLELLELSFYVEWGNFVPIAPNTVVMTTSVITDNAAYGLTEEAVRTEFAKFGIDTVIFCSPAEVCQHADACIARVGDTIYIAEIGDRSVKIDAGKTLALATETSGAALEELEGKVKSWVKESGGKLSIERLVIPLIGSMPGEPTPSLVFCSPVNLVETVNRKGERLLLLPYPDPESKFLDYSLRDLLDPSEWTGIDQISKANKAKLKETLPDGTVVYKVNCRFQHHGGPRCMTARLPCI